MFLYAERDWVPVGGKTRTGYKALRKVVDKHCEAGRHDEALRALERAYLEMEGRDDVKVEDMAILQNDMGAISSDLMELERAERHYKTGIQMLEDRGALGCHVHGRLLYNLGGLYLRMGRYEDAESTLQESIEVNSPLGTDKHEEVARATGMMGIAASNEGEVERSTELLRDAIDSLRSISDGKGDVIGSYHNVIGTNLYKVNDFASAEEHFQISLECYQDVLPFDHPWFIESLYNLSVAYEARGRYEDAEGAVLDAIARLGSQERPDPEKARSLKARLREVRRIMGDKDGRLEDMERRTVMLAADPSVDPHVLLDSYLELAEMQLTYRSFKVAFKTLRDAAAVAYQRLGPDHERTRELQKMIRDRSSEL